MTDTLTVEHTGTIRKSLRNVSAQYGDAHHHARHRVHPDIAITVLSGENGVFRFRQEVSLLGMKQTDEILQKRTADGNLESEVVSGTNQGTRLYHSFRALGPEATSVQVRVQIPLRGIKKILKPFFAMAVRSTLGKAFEEDRIDLEDRGYPRA